MLLLAGMHGGEGYACMVINSHKKHRPHALSTESRR